MPPCKRRAVLSILGTSILGGCLGNMTSRETTGQNNSTTSDSADVDPKNAGDSLAPEDTQMEDTQDITDECHGDREENLNRLPERSPLAETLEALYAAEDREAFSERHDAIEYRNGAVRVSIRLETEGTPPEEYLSEDYTAYDDLVVAFVEVDCLVDLALDDNVRAVRIPPQQELHGDE